MAIWIPGLIFPPSWTEAIVIPITKPGKDATDPSNYRPIALTSCICKTMERMINTRLTWYLESNVLITPLQSGFRKGRNTLDQLVRLETYIREAFVNKEHLVAVFFDMEKAYDTTWRYGIMKDLQEMNLRGRLPLFVKNFLKDRSFNVRLGTTLSEEHEQDMGVPQGSILSVTLFSIKVNSIVKCLSQDTKCSLYVDDFLICCAGRRMCSIERNLQNTITKLEEWADKNGFKFSKSKTECVHFTKSTRQMAEPKLVLNAVPIPVVEKAKFLGIFD